MPSDKPAHAAARQQDDAPRNILVVEDGADAARVLQVLLESLGHTVTIARTGAEAVSLFPSLKPDAVLLDISLPDMDGYAVARAIRQHDLGPRTILIAMTGWGGDEKRGQATAAGFDHHLLKPVPLDDLQRALTSRRD